MSKGVDKKSAKFALKIVKLKNFHIIKSDETYVDKAILENSDEDTIVATSDIALKKKLLEKKVPVIILRKKEYLMFAV